MLYALRSAVLSAVAGIRAASSSLNTSEHLEQLPLLSALFGSLQGPHVSVSSRFADLVTVMSIIILVFLFSLQRFGTARVSFLFAPIFTSWFIILALLGCYNIIKWDKTVFKAFNPVHIVYFFRRNGKLGWEHLGGIVLCMTGATICLLNWQSYNIHFSYMCSTSSVSL